MILYACNTALRMAKGAVSKAFTPLPFSPEIWINSIGIPCLGTRSASIRSFVPNQQISHPCCCNSRATAIAGNTCPPVPPAITNNFFAIDILFFALFFGIIFCCKEKMLNILQEFTLFRKKKTVNFVNFFTKSTA